MSTQTEIQTVTESEVIPVNQVATPAVLLQMAVSQNADIDKLEKLMELQAKWEAAESKKAFALAMTNFRAECPMIERTRKGHNSKYAGLAESIDAIKEKMANNGLSHNWKHNQLENGLISVTCYVTHDKGHSESTTLSASADDSGNKNDIQAIGSTVSYLERYTLYGILGLASIDQDDDGNAGSNNRNSTKIEKEWIERMNIIKTLIPTILQVKESLRDREFHQFFEAWGELSKPELDAIWHPAPTKGGILTTEERDLIKSSECQAVAKEIGYTSPQQ